MHKLGRLVLPIYPLLLALLAPSDPLEIRVYIGADASFTLYEDENDGYAYEKGVYATIPLHWDDAKQTLIIGERQGKFPGMLETRTLRVVFVDQRQGTGAELTVKPDKILEYSGRQVVVAHDKR